MGSVPLCPNFTGTRNGVIPCQNVDRAYRSIGSWLRYNFVAGSFYTMKLCSKLLMAFGQIFCEKRQIWVPEPYLEELGVTRYLG